MALIMCVSTLLLQSNAKTKLPGVGRGAAQFDRAQEQPRNVAEKRKLTSSCVDTDNGLLGTNYQGCGYYTQDNWECDTYTNLLTGFNARDLCCACGGGQITEDSTSYEDSTTTDGTTGYEDTNVDQTSTDNTDSTDSYDVEPVAGVWIDIDSNVGSWTASDDFGGRWMTNFGAVAGDWSYDASSVYSGTWTSDMTDDHGTWDISSDDPTTLTRIAYTSTTDDSSTQDNSGSSTDYSLSPTQGAWYNEDLGTTGSWSTIDDIGGRWVSFDG